MAEGVETQEQVDFLAQREPAMVYQGYLLGTPSLWTNGWPDRLPNMPQGPGRTEQSTQAAGCCSGFRRFDAKSVPKPLFKSASSYQKVAIHLLAALAPWCR